MQEILVVVDMQNDFIDMALGTPEAVSIVPKVEALVKDFSGKVIFTKDTHEKDYLQTQEGKNLPVEHCIRGSEGWEITKALLPYAEDVIEKPTFGSYELVARLLEENQINPIGKITLVGLCTDICVISNAMLLKAALLDAKVLVDASCCAGVTPASHKNALEAMKMCQITIINE
ncbi:MAG: cysteine hydrolase [Clostridia bacterium]|nr:cysteine hydrolase [Clostridia bacterium]